MNRATLARRLWRGGRGFGLVDADPSWKFADKLSMGERGAQHKYPVLDTDAIAALPVGELCAEDAVCALWVPSALALDDGKRVLASWGFTFKQIWVWVKTSKGQPSIRDLYEADVLSGFEGNALQWMDSRRVAPGDLKVAMGMGRLGRNAHEPVLIGTRGRYTSHVVSRRERNVILHPKMKHSEKPEELQDRLDRIFPRLPALELFARRDRPGWVCVGNQCPSTAGQDIRDVLPRLIRDRLRPRVHP